MRPWVSPPVRWIHVVFGGAGRGEAGGEGGLREDGPGEMVRFLAERGAGTPEVMREFDRMGYAYARTGPTALLTFFLRESRPGR